MDEMASLSHTKWECKYHVVFIPKCRRKVLYGELRKHLGEVLRRLAEQKESRIEEGHLMPDHVHMMMAIPPKYAVSQVIGYIKGKSAIPLARVYGEGKRNFVGQHFWARGFWVSRVGRDEAVIRDYIRNQEQEDQRLDQMGLWGRPATGKVAPNRRGRVSDPGPAALSGSQIKPPALPGDSYSKHGCADLVCVGFDRQVNNSGFRSILVLKEGNSRLWQPLEFRARQSPAVREAQSTI